MTLDPGKIAERLGAKHLGQLPDVGGGALGMSRLAAILKERLAPGTGTPSGKATSVRWVVRARVPMTRETEDRLIVLAEQLSTPQRRVTPTELAAQLLEETLRKLAASPQ